MSSIYGLSTDENPGCQDLDGDGGSELDDIPEEEDDSTPTIGVLGATIAMVANNDHPSTKTSRG